MANFKTAEEGMKRKETWTREKFEDSKFFTIEDNNLYAFEGSAGCNDVARYHVPLLESDDLIANDWIRFHGCSVAEDKPAGVRVFMSPLAHFPILMTLTDINGNLCMVSVTDIVCVEKGSNIGTLITFKSDNCIYVKETPEAISDILVDACTTLDMVKRTGKLAETNP